ncbi:MAG: AAA family ATPase [Clostridiales bacterium]|nr:AAA family ATPase [Clostridiales bacterium]
MGTDKKLFDGLAISRETKLCKEHLGQYPVVYISLKTAYAGSFDKAMPELCTIIGKEALRFRFLLDSSRLNEDEKELYRQLIRSDRSNQGVFSFPEAVVTASLNTLSMLLQKHYGQKAIILIDE